MWGARGPNSPLDSVSRRAGWKTNEVSASKRVSAVGRFPERGDEELLAGLSRNFQAFDPLNFLAQSLTLSC